ncbi:roadblock/LC7 domain-containing protein [Nonomuraea recticatena]|uniref:Roadblock/LC7 domain-containing protein n=1 Tax=Nonomuraea recticatena TaxID=46178 RepID=A0ABN3TEV0_9ACTN
MTTNAGADLNWLLDDLVNRVSGAEHAVVLSSDGLLRASSVGLQRSDGEHLSAVASSLQSLSKGVAEHVGGGAVRQTLVEWKSGFLIVSVVDESARLAVLCDRGADIGQVAHEMAMLVARVGQHLTSGARILPGNAGSRP